MHEGHPDVTPPWDLIAEWIPHVVRVAGAGGSTEYFNRRGYDQLRPITASSFAA